jgi:hypothetical protein
MPEDRYACELPARAMEGRVVWFAEGSLVPRSKPARLVPFLSPPLPLFTSTRSLSLRSFSSVFAGERVALKVINKLDAEYDEAS